MKLEYLGIALWSAAAAAAGFVGIVVLADHAPAAIPAPRATTDSTVSASVAPAATAAPAEVPLARMVEPSPLPPAPALVPLPPGPPPLPAVAARAAADPLKADARGAKRVVVAAAAPTPAPIPQTAAAEPPPPDPRPIVALQPFRTVTTATAPDGTVYTLTDLNHFVGRAFLFEKRPPKDVHKYVAHLENPNPLHVSLEVTPNGLAMIEGGKATACEANLANGHDIFSGADEPLTAYCNGRLWLRAQKRGFRTRQEQVTGMLRGLGGLGESVINLYKTTLGQDAELEPASFDGNGGAAPATATGAGVDLAPIDAMTRPRQKPLMLNRGNLGVPLAGDVGDNGGAPMQIGHWYPSRDLPGVFLGMMTPGEAPQEILDSYQDRVEALDEVERTALVYLMAFDLDRFEMNFTVGTDHPAVGWSPRAVVEHTNPEGPDGFSAVTPLSRVGMVRPDDLPRIVSVFAAGFKREHGAFKAGPFALVNNGTHYGFIEDGVVMSKIEPGLATVVGHLDGSIQLKTWTEADNADLPNIRFARQNGIPLIEPDAALGKGIPSPYVRDWLRGNWSGSLVPSTQKGVLRALRAGLCVQNVQSKRYLIYGYFTSVTPNAMARVFQAYSCSYGMHLDMNSPDLTYAVLFGHSQGNLKAEHLNRQMRKADTNNGDRSFRFLTENDNRDFFSILAKR